MYSLNMDGHVLPATSHLMPTYSPAPVTFVRGEGAYLWDSEGRRYLDFLSGLGVTSLGHSHPAVARAVCEAARTLVHTSNLFCTRPAEEVAAVLDRLLGGGGKVFFANSGAEANECAFKLARKWAGHGRYVVLSAYGSFHGRTLAALHATGQPEKHEAFQPLPEGFRHVAWRDPGALEKALAPDVAAVILEPVQGESGVWPAGREYFTAVRKLCDDHGVLFIVDEVQAGLARTGRWWGFEHYGVRPDIVTVAKALGNGVPIGACWARSEVARAFAPGDHASTFGGQPLAASAARAALAVMEEEDAPARAAARGKYLKQKLEGLPGVRGVRGLGLMLAAELSGGGAALVAQRCLEEGLVVNGVTASALRLEPPLLVTEEEIDEGVATLAKVLRERL
jgi:acetylornithine/N-succinyldiaminopimelate aminotransferase